MTVLARNTSGRALIRRVVALLALLAATVAGVGLERAYGAPPGGQPVAEGGEETKQAQGRPRIGLVLAGGVWMGGVALDGFVTDRRRRRDAAAAW